MSIRKNKDAVLAMMEAFNNADPDVVPQLLARTYRERDSYPLNREMERMPAIQRIQREIQIVRGAFRDAKYTTRDIVAEGNTVINRFFALDTRTYEAGALDAKTKELLGLVASMVLRCDDCVTYHLVRCREEGVTRGEAFDAFSVALVVGGSIVIPHLRRAVDRWSELEGRGAGDGRREAN